MKVLANLAYLWLSIAVLTGCGSRYKALDQAEKYLALLKDNEAKILMTIGGKEFYPEQSVFLCQLLASREVLSLALTDQYDGRTIINIAQNQWYANLPFVAAVDADGNGVTSLKIGKMIDRKKLIGEGYMMTRGTISVLTFQKEKVVFEIKGEVGPYSDFQTPDKHLGFEGIIVCKRPVISFGDITEKEVFGSTHSN